MGIDLSIIRGRVVTRKEAYANTEELNNVTSSGATSTISVKTNKGSLNRFAVTKTAGDCTSYDVGVYSSNSLSEASLVTAYSSTDGSDIDLVGNDLSRFESSSKNLYVVITPDSGINNNFTIKMFGDSHR